MKKIIRKNTFETNSSSIHTLCINKEDFNIPSNIKIDFSPGEFGWGAETLSSVHERASYLFTYIMNECYDYDYKTKEYKSDRRDELLNVISETLSKHNIQCEFHKGEGDFWKNGYIDHGSELNSFMLSIIENEDELLRFLFNDKNVIFIDNDNRDYDDALFNESEYPEDEYEIYVKGN